jgi:hypothetical protein
VSKVVEKTKAIQRDEAHEQGRRIQQKIRERKLSRFSSTALQWTTSFKPTWFTVEENAMGNFPEIQMR